MAQIDKNTVEATNQLKNKYVFIHAKENADHRVLFVGNSITLHGVKEDIGWFHRWGMAASREENDYVHCVMKGLEEENIHASFCICQVAVWETQYLNGSEILEKYYEYARNFNADIIVMRCIENCPCGIFDPEKFENEYKALIDYLDPDKKAKIILTTGFWKHPGDEVIEKTGRDRGYPCVYLGDLGENESMKAIGLFEHSGVANHPGDLGMKTIAKRVLGAIKKMNI